MALDLIRGIGLNKIIWRSILVFVMMPAYSSGASNQDLMNRIDDMEIQRMLDQDIQRQQQMQQPIINAPYIDPPYKNTMSSKQRSENANFYNLNVLDYLKKDEAASVQCAPYREVMQGITGRPYFVYGDAYEICYESSMLKISPDEVIARKKNLAKYCENTMPTSKQLQCFKEYLVEGKRRFLGFGF